MANQIVQVTAPSRLHFGLLSFGGSTGRQYGGIGMMIDRPATKLSIAPASDFAVEGIHRDRVANIVQCWANHQNAGVAPRCRITIQSAPKQHVGLGTGTQLALSIASGLDAFCSREEDSPAALAASVGRAKRSAIGTYGFLQGGLIFESGRLDRDEIGVLQQRIDVNNQWRILLIRPIQHEGLSGSLEKSAFRNLPPVPASVSKRLTQIAAEGILPAAVEARFEDFSENVYDYGRIAGDCFAEQQGGPYASRQLASIVDNVRRIGVAGVGQSSWGPTLFAILRNAEDADSLLSRLRSSYPEQEFDISVARPNNQGRIVNINRTPDPYT